MSETGYNERKFFILLDGTKIASCKSKSISLNKESVDVTTDDSDSWRRLLAISSSRSFDCSLEGVTTINNWIIIEEWESINVSDVSLQFPNGDILSSDSGFYFNDITFVGQEKGFVHFSCNLISSSSLTIERNSVSGNLSYSEFSVSGEIEITQLWTPEQLSNKQLWLDASYESLYSDAGSTFATDGQEIQEWHDISGSTNHCDQTTAGQKPIYKTNILNSLPVVRFDGSDFMRKKVLASPPLGITKFNVAQSYYFVAKISSFSGGTEETFMCMIRDGFNFPVMSNHSLSSTKTNRFRGFDNGGVSQSYVGATGGYPENLWKINSIRIKDTPKVVSFRLNGSVDGIPTFVSSDASFGNMDTYLVGCSRSGGVFTNFLGGDIAEIVVFNAEISDSDNDKMEGYLAWKWGLEGDLPISHPYKDSPPTV